MTFLSPHFLHALWLAPIAAALVLWAVAARRRAVRRFYGAAAGRAWAPLPGRARHVLLAILWCGSIALLAVALARPAHSPVPRKVQRMGRDVIFAIDVSRSMLAEDARPNRLERAKLMVSDVLEACEGDRVGLVAFAGTAVIRCPMTTDYAFARMSLEALGPDAVGRGGTALGDAVRAAMSLLGDESSRSSADIYLLTDGEDHESLPMVAAKEAAEAKIRLVTIGIGSDIGAPVPADAEQADRRGAPRSRYMEHEGERVQSRMNSGVLRQMAEATPGGVYLDVGVGNLELDRVYRLLRRDAEKREVESAESMRYTEAFQVPLAGALLLALLALIIDRLGSIRLGLRRLRPRSGPALALWACAALITLGAARPAEAQTLAERLAESNGAMARNAPGEALALLEAAAEKFPDSPELAYNRGCAQRALDQIDEAEASFRRADELASSGAGATEVAARARYNLGLIEAQRAAKQAESDGEAAMESLARAERWFRNARPGLRGEARQAAARNIERVQSARETIRRKLEEQRKEQPQEHPEPQSQSGDGQSQQGPPGAGQQQSPQGGGQNGEQQGEQQPSPEQQAAEDLAQLSREQEAAADQSASASRDAQSSPQQRQERSEQLARQQEELSKRAEQLEEQMKQQQGDGQSRQNMQNSRDQLEQARQAQARAQEQLQKGNTAEAERAQREAADKLREAARAAAGLDEQPQEPGEQDAQQARESDGQPQRAFDATAASILDREARNREAIRRALRAQQRARPPAVEKDW